jgi:hypothetical protein
MPTRDEWFSGTTGTVVERGVDVRGKSWCRLRSELISAEGLARVGEVLALRWDACQDGFLTFLETRNGNGRGQRPR